MYLWVHATGGAVPDGAAANGNEADGEPLFVARAKVHDGVHPGKVHEQFGSANIPYRGKEVKVREYEVLMNQGIWEPASGGQIPDDAVVCGHEADGTPLFAARAHYRGGLHPGKIRRGSGGANIPWGGQEVCVDYYEVLVEPGRVR